MRRLPVRTGLAAALLAIVVVPVATGLGILRISELVSGTRTTDDAPRAVQALAQSAPSWSDQAWRQRADRWFRDRRLHVVLYDAEQRTAYASPGTDPHASETGTIVPVTDAAGDRGYAFIRVSPVPPPLLLWLPGLLSLAGTLLMVGWLVSRTVVRPLAGLTVAARSVAAGELDFGLHPAAVAEIDQVSAAFTTMGQELRRSIERQAEMEEDRRLFISMVAHDLRTPLFALRGYLEGLELGIAQSPEMARRYIHGCIDKAAVLERRIADLFAYSRLEYLDQPPRREQFDLGDLLTRSVEDAGPAARTRGVTLQLEPPARGCAVDADPHMLGRVFENLLDNALRHTPAGGTVRLTWWRAGGVAVAKVADSGPGIDPARLPHLFEPRAGTHAAGAGLGLTIARRILRAHGGDLAARNLPDGGAELTASIGLDPGEPASGR